MEMRGNGYRPFVPPEAVSEAKIIRIIDGHYKLQFTVRDGGWITVNGKLYQLEYLDETHFRVKGGSCFHICEFGERVVDQGCIVAKINLEA